MAKANVSLSGKDILDLASMSVEEYELEMQTPMEMKKIMKRDIKKVPSLRGKSIINLFYEASTRTRTSFELAGKYLGADVVNITTAGSSVAKGECLRDTIFSAVDGCEAKVMRHPVEGSLPMLPGFPTPSYQCRDGALAHPTRGCLTILPSGKGQGLQNLKMAIVGDILTPSCQKQHCAWTKSRRCARAGRNLDSPRIEKLGKRCQEGRRGHRRADVVDILRIQLEGRKRPFPDAARIRRIFGINEQKTETAKPDVIVLHPGPMNRGLEISWEVGYCDNAAIRDEVQNGVAVRMALLFLTLTGGKKIENID
jgi:aspartate carbamoyltransferase catalytic subunit